MHILDIIFELFVIGNLSVMPFMIFFPKQQHEIKSSYEKRNKGRNLRHC
jgi:hypothetical protein